MTVVHTTAPAGVLMVLGPHEAWDHDWFDDGTTSDGYQCKARSEASGSRCPKPSAVALRTLHGQIFLCGGHYGVHRRGKPLTLFSEGVVS